MNKKQKAYIKALCNEYGNDPEVNMFPKPMMDAKFVEVLGEYFLGKDWQCSDPVSHDQVNVYMICDIIQKYKSKAK